MFSFLFDTGNHADRVIDNYQAGDEIEIDTCRVSDGKQPYETGIRHPEFNDGRWIIVEAYDTRDLALAGHSRWVHAMTTAIPDVLTDCQNAHISDWLSPDELLFARTTS